VDPVPDPLLIFSGSAGNRTRASGSGCPQHNLNILLLHSIFLLTAMSLLKYVLNCEQNFQFFIFRIRLSDIQINYNRISEGLLRLCLVLVSSDNIYNLAVPGAMSSTYTIFDD
jgi:hypothetical protein